MTPLEILSTDGLAPRRKIEYWNELACETFTPITSHPADFRTFSGRLTRTKIGDICVAEVYSDPSIVRHSRSQVAQTREPMFFLHLQIDGESINRQDGREAVLGPGDFTICDSTRPYEMIFKVPNHRFVLGIPDALWRRRIANPESIVAIAMSGKTGLSGVTSRFLPNFWNRCRQGLDPNAQIRVANATLDLIASAYAALSREHASRSTIATAHRVRIKNYIEAHLRDPELTPARIAHACNITVRYLHYLFEDDGETVARYILRRRLEECARALRIAPESERTVTAVAFDYGFNSLTHFGRVFSRQFGISPSDYRRQHAAQSDTGAS